MDLELRYVLYDLFFSMFVREPSDSIIDGWRRVLIALQDAQPDAAFGQMATRLLDMLHDEDANETVRSEFNRLFGHPLGPAVSIEASHYADGQSFGNYLVGLRTFIEKTPFRKCDDYAEPEDTLPFHFDLMRAFIGEEQNAAVPHVKAEWRALQRELMNDFLAPWIDGFLSALAKQGDARFYQQAALLLQLYLEHEREFLLEEPAG